MYYINHLQSEQCNRYIYICMGVLEYIPLCTINGRNIHCILYRRTYYLLYIYDTASICTKAHFSRDRIPVLSGTTGSVTYRASISLRSDYASTTVWSGPVWSGMVSMRIASYSKHEHAR